MNELHKSRFEGDNFRNRYMSKCYAVKSESDEYLRIKRIKSLSSRISKHKSGDCSGCLDGLINKLMEVINS